MTDWAIERGADSWDLLIENGDIVWTGSVSLFAEVSQRVTYRVMTWLGESVYDRNAGVPYLELVFGETVTAAVVSLLTAIIRETDGVDEIIETPTFLLDPTTRVLSVSCVIKVGTEEGPVSIEVASP